MANSSASTLVYVSHACEALARPAQRSMCYREANESLLGIDGQIKRFYTGSLMRGNWWPEEDLTQQMLKSARHLDTFFEEVCEKKQACVFNLLIQEQYAIEEKLERYRTEEIVFRDEASQQFKQHRTRLPLIHSDSPFMVQRFGLSNPAPPVWMKERETEVSSKFKP